LGQQAFRPAASIRLLDAAIAYAIRGDFFLGHFQVFLKKKLKKSSQMLLAWHHTACKGA
jgi:hypothetical protein